MKAGARCRKVQPYHSAKQGAYVHHVCSNCTVGNNIEPENKRSGTGGKRKCMMCIGLGG